MSAADIFWVAVVAVWVVILFAFLGWRGIVNAFDDIWNWIVSIAPPYRRRVVLHSPEWVARMEHDLLDTPISQWQADALNPPKPVLSDRGPTGVQGSQGAIGSQGPYYRKPLELVGSAAWGGCPPPWLLAANATASMVAFGEAMRRLSALRTDSPQTQEERLRSDYSVSSEPSKETR